MSRLNVIAVTVGNDQQTMLVVMENILYIEKIRRYDHDGNEVECTRITFVNGSTMITSENFDTLYDALHN